MTGQVVSSVRARVGDWAGWARARVSGLSWGDSGGCVVGEGEGAVDGPTVGRGVGAEDGSAVGTAVVGSAVGNCVGAFSTLHSILNFVVSGASAVKCTRTVFWISPGEARCTCPGAS